jgi:chromosome partitioning protein
MRLHRSGILEKGLNLGLIANRARTNTSYYKVLENFLSRLDLPIVTVLRDTQNYVKAMNAGLSIFDLPAYRMRSDLLQWQPVIHWLCQK